MYILLTYIHIFFTYLPYVLFYVILLYLFLSHNICLMTKEYSTFYLCLMEKKKVDANLYKYRYKKVTSSCTHLL
jgi:hypothetical protein